MADHTEASRDPEKAGALSRMEQDWDARARQAPEYFIATGQRNWGREEFFEGGAVNVNNEILADADFITRGRPLGQMRVLEIGCGAGRMTRAMAGLFGEVHAVDISAEMISLARRNLSDLRNVFLYKNSGTDLSELQDGRFDFAFSFIVFQHIPSLAVIESYVREVHRCLRPGAVFKFQVQGDMNVQGADDTWVGVSLSLADAEALAVRCGFDLIRAAGQGTQYFWLWFLKPKLPWIPRVIRSYAAEALALLRADWLPRFRDAAVLGRFWLTRPVAIVFSPDRVCAGEWYCVRIPSLAGQAIDVGYQLKTTECLALAAGVVVNWCSLDSRGEARLLVPSEHPEGTVRITKVRSRTLDQRWRRARASIQVLPAGEGRRTVA